MKFEKQATFNFFYAFLSPPSISISISMCMFVYVELRIFFSNLIILCMRWHALNILFPFNPITKHKTTNKNVHLFFSICPLASIASANISLETQKPWIKHVISLLIFLDVWGPFSPFSFQFGTNWQMILLSTYMQTHKMKWIPFVHAQTNKIKK